MENVDHPHGHTPNQPRNAERRTAVGPAARQQSCAHHDVPQQKGAVEEAEAGVFLQVGGPSLDVGIHLVLRMPGKQPQHVGPETAVARGVGVALLIAKNMVLAMIGHPDQRRPFSRDAAKEGKKPSHRPECAKAPVRQQTVVAETDAQPAGHPGEHHGDQEPGPGEAERGRQRSDVNPADPAQDRPVDVRPAAPHQLLRTVATRLGSSLRHDHRVEMATRPIVNDGNRFPIGDEALGHRVVIVCRVC